MRYFHDALHGRVYQGLALLFCVLFGTAMIVNTQMSGEGVWFWYAIVFHRGVKLYADLHFALQPLFVLETDVWMKFFGTKCLVTEIPSVLHIVAFCLSIFLVLQQSDWPDWQKAIILASAFVLTVSGGSYRFDDYHITTDGFILYSLLMLLLLAKADAVRRQFLLAVMLGIMSGFAMTTRMNDGGALLVATALCILFVAKRRRVLVAGLFVLAAALTVLFVVKCTGDSFSDYISNSVIKAASSKGGPGSVFAAPFLLFRNVLHEMRIAGKWILLWVFAIVAVGPLVQRYWKRGGQHLVLLQLGIAGTIFIFCSHVLREQLLSGELIRFLIPVIIVVNYLIAPIVAARYVIWKTRLGGRAWDVRESLVLLPLAEWASASTSSAGQPHTGYYVQASMLLLLVPVIQPFRRHASWANASFVTILALLGLSATTSKILNPYSWQNYRSNPMFLNREWYGHPVYGPLYIDRDQLELSKSICAEIGQPNSGSELLSLPYPYPNYFCAIPPWHEYVQTFFDTSTRATINHLIAELNTAPPKWIVYQRQLHIMSGAELAYNHGEPLAQRDLDNMLIRKIATGQWQLVDKKDYSQLVEKNDYLPGDGWYVIRTRP